MKEDRAIRYPSMRSIRIGDFFACELRHQDYAQKLASGRLPGGYVVITVSCAGLSSGSAAFHSGFAWHMDDRAEAQWR